MSVYRPKHITHILIKNVIRKICLLLTNSFTCLILLITAGCFTLRKLNHYPSYVENMVSF